MAPAYSRAAVINRPKTLRDARMAALKKLRRGIVVSADVGFGP